MNISIPLDAPERSLPGGDAVELFVGAPLWTFGHGVRPGAWPGRRPLSRPGTEKRPVAAFSVCRLQP